MKCFQMGYVCDEGDRKIQDATLGEINGYMASIADEVVEVVYGIPVLLKGRK